MSLPPLVSPAHSMTPTNRQIQVRLEAFDWLQRMRPVSRVPVSEVMRDYIVFANQLRALSDVLRLEVMTDGSLAAVQPTPNGNVIIDPAAVLASLAEIDLTLHTILATLGLTDYLRPAHDEFHFSLTTSLDPATRQLPRDHNGALVAPATPSLDSLFI